MTGYNKETSPAASVLICGVKGLAVGVILAAVLLFLFTAVAYSATDPDSLTAPLGYVSLYLSAISAGIAAARFSRETGGMAALAGGAAGVMLLFAVILLSLIPAQAPEDVLSPMTSVLMYAAIPAASALGGFLLRKRKSRKIKHKRRR